ncbi:MAG: hypothetical protein GQF41_2937 [Candidatus Rifleibacterium amylolyticum]|nr:MAG: hypothetical protein GQF41_2937 [Candidatus Rifleibacterium amylolyticum]
MFAYNQQKLGVAIRKFYSILPQKQDELLRTQFFAQQSSGTLNKIKSATGEMI